MEVIIISSSFKKVENFCVEAVWADIIMDKFR